MTAGAEREEPELVIRLALEQPGRVELHAATREDELRLRRWLRGSAVWERLPGLVDRLLDDLDDLDRTGEWSVGPL
jgi:hypothetical protein